MNRKKKLGQILVEKKAITTDQLEKALEIQKSSGQRLGRILIKLGYITEEELLDILEEQLEVERINLFDYYIDPAAARIIPEHMARRYQAVPIKKEGNTLIVAMVDPSNVVALDDLQLTSKLSIKPVLATQEEIEEALDKIYRVSDLNNHDLDGLKNISEWAATIEEEVPAENLQINDAPVVRAVNYIIDQAVQSRASDVHIEPLEEKVRIRFRIDGLLREMMSIPRNAHPLVVSRIKIMAQMDIAEKRNPQDGRINMVIGDHDIDIRVSTLPTIFGEKIVLRMLDKANMILELNKLGLSKKNYDRFEKMIMKPYGMILVTGPTGSGKTTTLYSTLEKINTVEKNIITIEDPVEYILNGINQIAVNPKAGLTFANGLRSILRQDPDVIMVGEIRDVETSQIAIQAANTGHLVFSTLHTNNAASALTRLLDMGLEPYLAASSVIGIMAQRLVRRICTSCKKEINVPPDGKERLILGITDDKPLKIYNGEGCKNCGGTGYRGRTAVTELLEVNLDIQKLILKKASSGEIAEEMQRNKMPFLWDDAVEKVLAGVTTIDELIRLSV